MHRITKIAAAAAIATTALVATSTAANAYTMTDSGVGFVGKGEVQTVMGWNNAALQTNAEKLTFTTRQAVEQSLTQALTQVGAQSGTQTVSQDVTCTVETGKKTFHRDGERDGTRTGAREGSRDGSRTGVSTGTVGYSVDYTARKANQFTGFILGGLKNESITLAPVVWGGQQFGAYVFAGDYAFGDIEWGGWQAAPGSNPAECLGGNPGVTDLVNVITDGATVDGAVVDGAVTEGAVTEGPVVKTGSAALYVNGRLLPNVTAPTL